jgi:hypothetical protein
MRAQKRVVRAVRADRVLYRGSADVQLALRSERIASELVDDTWRPLSDHLAVAVQFEERRDLEAR